MRFELLRQRVERAETRVESCMDRAYSHRQVFREAWRRGWTPGRIVVAGLLSGFLGSLAGVFNACSTLFTVDLYEKWNPGASQEQLVRTGRIATAVMVLAAILWLPVVQGAHGLGVGSALHKGVTREGGGVADVQPKLSRHAPRPVRGS